MSQFALQKRNRPWSTALALLTLVLAVVGFASSVLPAAQEPAPLWQVKDVAALDLGPANCLRYPRINGFDFAPDGTPTVGWTQVEGCGGNTWTAWAEERDGAWQTHQFPAGSYSSHELGLGGDGQPYMFFQRWFNLYYDVAVGDLRAIARGEPGVAGAGDYLGTGCVSTRLRLATRPGQTLPSRALALRGCNGQGPLRLDGTTLVEDLIDRAHDYSIGPSGKAHLAFLNGYGGAVYYLRPGRSPVRVATVNSYSDDIAIAEGADGVIHMVVRGFDNQADYDRGYLGYLRSTDDGLTWTYVDRVDANKDQWGLSLQVDADGQPAVAYWYYNQLTYATRASGVWVKSVVAQPTWQGTEWLKPPRLRFDASGVPHIAYYDWTANRIRVIAPSFYEAPALTNPGDQSSVEGDTISLPLSWSVGGDAIAAMQPSGLPPGLFLDSTTFTIAGTLNDGSAGTYPVTITLQDGTSEVSVSFVWTVVPRPPPPPPPTHPTLTLPGGYSYAAAAYGVELTYEIIATTTNAGATLLPIAHSALPPGATVTAISESGPPASRSYRFAWTPQPAFDANGALITSRVVCYSISDSTGRAMLGNACVTVSLPPVSKGFSSGTLWWERLSGGSSNARRVKISFEGEFSQTSPPFGVTPLVSPLTGFLSLKLAGTDYNATLAPEYWVTQVSGDRIHVRAIAEVEIPETALPVTVTYEECCRLSTLSDGNADTPVTLVTSIPANQDISRSPLSTVTPRIHATVNQPLVFQLPAAAFNNLVNRFSVTPAADSGLVTPHPGAAPFISDLGVISWTPSSEGLHAFHYTITSINPLGSPMLSTQVEVTFDVRPPCVDCGVTLTAPPAVFTSVGVEGRAVVTATAPAPGQVPELEHTPLANGMQVRRLTTAQSSTWEVTWSPIIGQRNSFVCFQARAGAAVSFGQVCSTFTVAAASVRTLTGVVREFQVTHPDMNRPAGDAAPQPDFVLPTLGADLKPVFDVGAGASVTQFGQWFNDVTGANTARVHSLWMGNWMQVDPGVFQFSSTNWRPFDGARFFTFEAHTAMTYEPGRNLTFKASGDMWVFINRVLVPGSNLHGVHGERTFTVLVDSLGLTPGEAYPVDIFYAHRGAATTPGIQVQLGPELPIPATPEVITIPAGGFTPAVVNPLGVSEVATGQLHLLAGTGTNDAGAAWLASDFFWLNGFELDFTYTGSPVLAGEGFAAVIAATPAVGGAAGGLGYDGIGPSLAVEFDAKSSGAGDPMHQHIAVHSNGPGANSSLPAAAIGVQPFDPNLTNSFFNSTPQHVRVAWAPVTTQPFGWLRVWMNDNLVPAIETMLSRDALAALLNEGRGFLGFTAGRGPTSSSLTIQSARLTTYPESLFNHPPEATVTGLQSGVLHADEGTQVNVPVVVSDVDRDQVVYSFEGLPSWLSPTEKQAGLPGVYHFYLRGTPPVGSAGYDPVLLRMSDGTLNSELHFAIWVHHDGPNRPPVAVDDAVAAVGMAPIRIYPLVNDRDPEHEGLTVVGSTDGQLGRVVNAGPDWIEYAASNNVVATDAFTYTVRDGFGLEATATVTIALTRGPRTIDVLKFGDGTGRIVSDPAGVDCGGSCTAQFPFGSLVQLSAVADAGSEFVGWARACSGTDLTCSLSGDNPSSVAATFRRRVAPALISPFVDLQADEDTAPLVVEAASHFDVAAGTNLGYTATTVASWLTVSTNPVTGRVTLTPAANRFGVAQVEVRATTADGLFASDAFAVTINPVNDLPTSNMADTMLFEGAPVFYIVYLFDLDGDQIDAQFSGLPPGISTTRYDAGENGLSYQHVTIEGTPAAGSAGQYPGAVTMNDGTGTAVKPFVITVRPPNRAPIAVADSVTATWALSTSVVIPVLANDSDPDGDALTIDSVSAASQGDVAIRNGAIEYQPHAFGWLTDSFQYTVSDGFGGVSVATVTVRMLTPGPDAVLRLPAEPTAVALGQNFTIPLTVTNEGAEALSHVSVRIELGNGLELVSASAPESGAGPRDYLVGAVAAGETRTLSLLVRADVHGVPSDIQLSASISARSPDEPSGNNEAATVIRIQPDFCFAPLGGLRGIFRAEDVFTSEPPLGGPLAGAGFAPSRIGRAFSLDGFQSIPLRTGADRTTAFTVAAWAARATDAAGYAPVIGDGEWTSYNHSYPDVRYSLGFENGHPVFALYDRLERVVNLVATAATAPEAWVHLAATFDGGHARLFVNGIEAATATIPPIDFPFEREALHIGEGFGVPDLLGAPDASRFKGLIDDVAIYGRVLDAAEVRRMVDGLPTGCVLATDAALGLQLSVTPSISPTESPATITAVVTNHSNGYLQWVEIESSLETPLLFIDPPSTYVDWMGELPGSRRWAVGPMLAGESRTLTATVQTPTVDGHFVNHVRAFDTSSGAEASADQLVSVGGPACFDAEGNPAPATCTINEHPVMVNPGPQAGKVDSSVSLQIIANDPDNTAPLVFTAVGLPDGLSIDSATGLVSGVILPAGSGERQVTVHVSDSKLTRSVSFLWTTMHQLRVNLAKGGHIRYNGTSCDAMAAPVSCVIDVPVAIGGVYVEQETVGVVPGVSHAWYLNDGGTGGQITVSYSRTLDVYWVTRFTVTLENPAFPVWQQFHATIPVVRGGTLTQPDYIACGDSELECVGQALFESTVELFAGGRETRVFDGYGGACQGFECVFVADREGIAITVRYSTRPVNLTLDVGPGGLVRFGDGQVCDGATTGRTCTVAVPIQSNMTLTPESAVGNRWLYSDLTHEAPPLVLPTPLPNSGGVTGPASFPMDRDRRLAVGFQAPLFVALPGLTGQWNALFTYPTSASDHSFPLIWGSGSCGNFHCPGDHLPVGSNVNVPFASAIPLFFPWGQVVTMTPRATLPLNFIGWTGACTGTGTCTVRPGIDTVNVVGTFGFPITFNIGAGGTITIDGQVCGDPVWGGGSCTVVRTPGWSAAARSNPIGPGLLTHWSGQSAGAGLTAPELWVVATDARTIDVTFLAPFTGRVVAGGSLSAQLPPSPLAQVSGPQSGVWNGVAPVGSVVTWSATALSGYSFTGWNGACTGLGPCAMTVSQAGLAVEATFNRQPAAGPAVSVTTNSNAAVTLTVTGTDAEGDTLSAEQVGNPGVPTSFGVLTKSGAMSWLFTPNPSFVGQVTFFYRVSDGFGYSEVRTAVIDVQQPTTVIVDVVENITVSDVVAANPAVMVAVSETIQVTDAVNASPAVQVVITESIVVADTVMPATSNTPAGSGVSVAASGPGTGPSPVVLTFAGVTQPGNTTYSVLTNQQAPDGFRFGSPPVLFDIVTTAQYTAPVRVCLTYPAGSVTNPSALRLFHYESGRWVDRTVSVDVKARVVCGSVSSLSPFALAEAIAIEGRMQGHAELEAAGLYYRLDFKVAERRLGRERGELDLEIHSPRRGRHRESADRFESTEIDEIFFWDDPAFRPGRNKKPKPAADSVVFTGTGKWNGRRGYTFEARAIDQGEPGQGRDRFTITIWDTSGAVVATVDGVLTDGNIQSERLKREHWR